MARRFYGFDLAFIHDAGFGAFARAAAPERVRTLLRAGIRRGRIVELGCGSGAATAVFCRAGYDVLGIDASPHMIRLAKKSAPKARYAVARLPSISVPACDAVVAVGEVLNYMPKPSSFDALFKKVARALGPGGVFVFDAKLPSGKTGPVVRVRSAKGWCVRAVSTEDARGRLVRRIASFRRVGRAWRRTDETHRLTLLSVGALTRKLGAAGFSVRTSSRGGAVVVAARREG